MPNNQLADAPCSSITEEAPIMIRPPIVWRTHSTGSSCATEIDSEDLFKHACVKISSLFVPHGGSETFSLVLGISAMSVPNVVKHDRITCILWCHIKLLLELLSAAWRHLLCAIDSIQIISGIPHRLHYLITMHPRV